MKLYLATLCIVLSTLSADAGDVTVRAADVLSAVSGYQNGGYFKAVLVQGEEDADLYIFGRDGWDMHLEAHAPGIAFTGIGGSDASLAVSEQGDLQVRSENIAIGRHRWQQILTVARRDGRFIVAGFTYSYYDTIESDEKGEVKNGQCDLNLLTGEGEKDGEAIKTRFKPVAVTKWTAETRPPECTWN